MESTTDLSAMDLANVERIEVMKGASGTLFGSAVSSFGGVVNLVTKKPIEAKRTEFTYMIGSLGPTDLPWMSTIHWIGPKKYFSV